MIDVAAFLPRNETVPRNETARTDRPQFAAAVLSKGFAELVQGATVPTPDDLLQADQLFQDLVSGPLSSASQIILFHSGTLSEFPFEVDEIAPQKVESILALRLKSGPHAGAFRSDTTARAGSLGATWIAVTALKRSLYDPSIQPEFSSTLRSEVQAAIRQGEEYLDERWSDFDFNEEPGEIRALVRTLAALDTCGAGTHNLSETLQLHFHVRQVAGALHHLRPENDPRDVRSTLPAMVDFLVPVLSVLGSATHTSALSDATWVANTEDVPSIGRPRVSATTDKDAHHLALSVVIGSLLDHQNKTDGHVYESVFLTGVFIAACEQAIAAGIRPEVHRKVENAIDRAYAYLEGNIDEPARQRRRSNHLIKREMTSPAPKGFQVHHVIPVEISRHPKIGPFLIGVGVDIEDGLSNSIQLPGSEKARKSTKGFGRSAIHNGSHPKYTAAIEAQLLQIATEYQDLLSKRMPEKYAKAAAKLMVLELIRETQSKLLKGEIDLK